MGSPRKRVSGTILTAISNDYFVKVIFHKIREGIQTEIQQKVIESFILRKQSKHLLECAKPVVEITIKQDEQTAVN